MSELIHFTIPAGPSTNRMYRSGKGRLYKSKLYKAWLHDAWGEILVQVTPELLPGQVAVTIVAQPKDGRVRDVDNYCKAVLDGLEFWGFLTNDKQVNQLSIIRLDPDPLINQHRLTIHLETSS